MNGKTFCRFSFSIIEEKRQKVSKEILNKHLPFDNKKKKTQNKKLSFQIWNLHEMIVCVRCLVIKSTKIIIFLPIPLFWFIIIHQKREKILENLVVFCYANVFHLQYFFYIPLSFIFFLFLIETKPKWDVSFLSLNFSTFFF